MVLHGGLKRLHVQGHRDLPRRLAQVLGQFTSWYLQHTCPGHPCQDRCVSGECAHELLTGFVAQAVKSVRGLA